ncbi:MAG: phosphoenolpyruvate carboxylase [Xanthomonadales bacterium]|jgi:phosphoenolpyruvate carboxylase|nr:phosphoenolpyruvate carboxylase [Xanthomonadales bacterium]
MHDLRRIDVPPKDRPLKADVRLLGELLGQVLVEQHGAELLEKVESVRKAAIRQREIDSESGLDEALGQLGHEDVMLVVKAFASYLRLANLAEKTHRLRRRRVYLRAQAGAQPGSLEHAFGLMKQQGVSPEALEKAVNELRIQPVFTAHPTEATRRTIQEREYEILLRLGELMNPELTPDEERLAMERIRAAMTVTWQTRLAPHQRPTVADELDNILFYLTDILYRVTPLFYESLRSAWEGDFGACPEDFLSEEILRFGSWVGGDMDGNPNVTAKTILATLATQRAVIIRRYLPDVRRLGRFLSQSLTEAGFSPALLDRLDLYRKRYPEIDRSIPERLRDMPYRCLLRMVAARLEATLADEPQAYRSAERFAADIRLVRDSLETNRGAHGGMFSVDRLLRRIRTFGFHLATLDVRQDALRHREVIGELLGIEDWLERSGQDRAEELARMLESGSSPRIEDDGVLSDAARETLEVFRALCTARADYGESAVGLFIVSMAQGAEDVLGVLLLAGIANPGAEAGRALDVAPLLETVDDLEAGPGILRGLLDFPAYREHLDGRGRRQVVMVGYSDSNKDSGIVASRWALHESQRRLTAAGRASGIDIVFFHGRGGTVSRGGGNLVNGILGAPPDTVGGFLRLTEQGEVINQKYGMRFLAERNLELVTGATLYHTMGFAAQGLSVGEQEILAFMADRSRQHFRSLVYQDPGFPAFFRASTPIDVIEQLNIGSRPASRRSGEGIENLRAIPWVFSWAQVRVGFPGVFGFGTALEQAIDRFGMARVRDLLASQVFFQAMVSDVEMVLAKSDLEIGARYAALAGAEGQRFLAEIEEEFERAERRILELKQLDRLLDDQQVLQRNIRLRNPYVDPIHYLQIGLLQRWRAGGRSDDGLLEPLKATVKGIALGIQNTG